MKAKWNINSYRDKFLNEVVVHTEGNFSFPREIMLACSRDIFEQTLEEYKKIPGMMSPVVLKSLFQTGILEASLEGAIRGLKYKVLLDEYEEEK